ncbi:MAG TPA: alpha/beta-hydrolase family protein [Euzebyales bacterium]
MSLHLGMWFSPGEWLAASLFFAASLTPSLYPRPWLTQGVLSGAAVAIGLGTGRANRRLVSLLPTRPPAAPPAARAAVLLLAGATASWALLANYHWQVDVRRLMTIDGDAAPYLASAVAVAAAIAYAVVLVVRLAHPGLSCYAGLVTRIVPRRGRGLAHTIVALAVTVAVIDIGIASELVPSVNDRLVAADAGSDPDVRPPRSGGRSGSRASLVAWDSLGRMGRRFVATAPTVGQLRAFSGAPARAPIRAYVGLASAPSVQARADLAVAELERTGAFDRDVLLVITATGTGSVNRHAVAPLEYMYRGDTAAVAVQYSYLPSWLVMGGNQDRARTTASALFDAVTRRLRRRPLSARPLLLLYGESLGSFGSEQVFADLADIRAHVDGALWVGPTRANPLWRQFTAARDAGSPQWRPVYQDGRTVRFATNGEDLNQSGRWSTPRVVYLQHPSDPVTWWTPDLAFTRPAWLRDPRPRGISPRTPYLPIITFVQTTIDTILGGNAPTGHGHIYGPEHVDAWAHIAAPTDWTRADTTRLRARLESLAD